MKTVRILLGALPLLVASASHGENLYKPSGWSAMSADRRAGQVGDALTVLVVQNAQSTSVAKTDSSRNTTLGGGLNIGSINESGSFKLGGGYSGGGEVRRSESFVTQITVTVEQVLPNGDMIVSGHQAMRVNGEDSDIGVRGRVRAADIAADNSVASNRLADAQINYDGRGFVSRSAKPGLINRIFRGLGLG